ncbi:MAG: hypothetical protein PVS3B3_36900 [Ktedonobacteraceae bacterium]
MRRIGGVILTITGFLACPCHLIITLPLLATLFAGTALGSFLSHNIALVTTVATIYFVVALAMGYWFLVGPKCLKQEVDTLWLKCMPGDSETSVHEPSTQPVNLTGTPTRS